MTDVCGDRVRILKTHFHWPNANLIEMNRQRYRPGKSGVAERKISLKSQLSKEFYLQKRRLSKNLIYCSSRQLNLNSTTKGMYTENRFHKHTKSTYACQLRETFASTKLFGVYFSHRHDYSKLWQVCFRRNSLVYTCFKPTYVCLSLAPLHCQKLSSTTIHDVSAYSSLRFKKKKVLTTSNRWQSKY